MTNPTTDRREDAAVDAFYRTHIERAYHSPKGRAKALANRDGAESWRPAVRAALRAALAEAAPAPNHPCLPRGADETTYPIGRVFPWRRPAGRAVVVTGDDPLGSSSERADARRRPLRARADSRTLTEDRMDDERDPLDQAIDALTTADELEHPVEVIMQTLELSLAPLGRPAVIIVPIDLSDRELRELIATMAGKLPYMLERARMQRAAAAPGAILVRPDGRPIS